jgi:hypothetical protein
MKRIDLDQKLFSIIHYCAELDRRPDRKLIAVKHIKDIIQNNYRRRKKDA